MKHLRVVSIGFGLLVGIPWALLAIGGGPVSAVRRTVGDGLSSAVERLVALSELITWCLWLWVLGTIIRQLLFARRLDSIGHSRHHLVTMFVTSLWALALSSRVIPSGVQATEDRVETVGESSRIPMSSPLVPLASIQCSLIAEFMLRRFAEERSRAIRSLGREEEIAPLSKPSGMFWQVLRENATGPQVEGVPLGIGVTGDLVSSPWPIEVRGTSSEDVTSIHDHLEMAVVASGIDVFGANTTEMIQESRGWRTSSGECVQPFALSTSDKESFHRLVRESSVLREVSDPRVVVPGDWVMCVRLLGPVEARWNDNTELEFRKSKALELLAWLVTHPDRPTRVAARTAMWIVDVHSSYFNNVVSDLRASLASFSSNERFDLLERTERDRLVLDNRIVSDADVLRSALHRFRAMTTPETRDALRSALSLVRNLPFSGSDYLWPDPEGITSNLVHLVMSASLEFAEDALGRSDIDGVYFATDKGLKVFPGDEELLSLRAAVSRKASVIVRDGRSG